MAVITKLGFYAVYRIADIFVRCFVFQQ